MNYSIFFAVIGLMMAVACALQFFIAYDLHDLCDAKLASAPMTAGWTLLASFVTNSAWVYGKQVHNSMIRRVSILLWTILVVVGTAAAGASLSQVQLYKDVGCKADSSEALHLVTIVLLVLSISLPHGIQKRHKDRYETIDTNQPVVATRPLNFL